ncbi:MAG: ATP-dependent helicase [Bacillales bacterium]|jgi:SNF2 family DNA or RNA helicase|nr:ATP-dependent helicase [Bacillales bacterium]
MKNITVSFNPEWRQIFEKKVAEDGPWCNYDLYKLAIKSAKSTLVPDFHGLKVKEFLANFEPLEHQLQTAQEVIEKMNGKAILADEVGLGKTIEAGLILKEYLIRGLVKKVLILVPASLASQWSQELIEKFHIPAVIYKKNMGWNSYNIFISSIDMAKRAENMEQLVQEEFDLIIIDEAHKLKNKQTKNYELVQKLSKKYCLLLTATPIQNKLEEIFYLVSLLKPGHLGNYEAFMKRFSTAKRSVQDDHILKELISKVMVRNRRENTGIEWTKRNVETIFIEMSPTERVLYDAVSKFRSDFMSTLILQREACSSREAVYFTLKNCGHDGLLPYIEQVDRNSKAEKALELIQKINDKVLIFTEYRATQLYLQWYFKMNGIISVPFRGGFKRSKKDWMQMLFQNRAQVMIATEAGGEGLNLQFCHNIINFDLPWNPMRLEQRIGRIHRFGQTEDVNIYNFATKNTVEEHVMRILYEKIQLFEDVVGELDDILTRLEVKNLEKHLVDILSKSKTEGEMRVKMDNLTSLIEFAKELGNESHSHRVYSS